MSLSIVEPTVSAALVVSVASAPARPYRPQIWRGSRDAAEERRLQRAATASRRRRAAMPEAKRAELNRRKAAYDEYFRQVREAAHDAGNAMRLAEHRSTCTDPTDRMICEGLGAGDRAYAHALVRDGYSLDAAIAAALAMPGETYSP